MDGLPSTRVVATADTPAAELKRSRILFTDGVSH